MHDPSLKDGNGNHVCKVMHCTNYPVQKCFNVCGVITGVMAAITCISPNLYLTLTTPSQFKPNIYVQDPTKYSKFLRQVIMCWIAEDSINIHHVIPTEFSTIEADGVSCTDTEPNTSEEELEEEEVVTNIKQEVVERGSTQERTAAGGKKKTTSFKCHLCGQITTRSTTLRRHMERKHKDDPTKNEGNSNNKCVCIECDYTCRRIKELRDHLSKHHLYTFRSEQFEFDSIQGVPINKYIYLCVDILVAIYPAGTQPKINVVTTLEQRPDVIGNTLFITRRDL